LHVHAELCVEDSRIQGFRDLRIQGLRIQGSKVIWGLHCRWQLAWEFGRGVETGRRVAQGWDKTDVLQGRWCSLAVTNDGLLTRQWEDDPWAGAGVDRPAGPAGHAFYSRVGTQAYEFHKQQAGFGGARRNHTPGAGRREASRHGRGRRDGMGCAQPCGSLGVCR
jgi:hypothetical protein